MSDDGLIVLALIMLVILLLVTQRKTSTRRSKHRRKNPSLLPTVEQVGRVDKSQVGLRACQSHGRDVSYCGVIARDWIHATFDMTRPQPEVKFGRCSMSGSKTFGFRSTAMQSVVHDLFYQCVDILSCTIGPTDLFHAHVIWTSAGRCALLFHAFEYPYDAEANLGFCQQGSRVSVYNPNFPRRNLYVADLSTSNKISLQVVPAAPPLYTRFAEEFGLELGQIVLHDSRLVFDPIDNSTF